MLDWIGKTIKKQKFNIIFALVTFFLAFSVNMFQGLYFKYENSFNNPTDGEILRLVALRFLNISLVKKIKCLMLWQIN